MATLIHHHIPFSTQDADLDLSSIDPFLLDPADLPRSRKISMVENNLFNIPLSPPTSPRLSTFQSDQAENSWQDHSKNQIDNNQESEGNMTLVHSDVPNLTLDTKPMLRSHKAFSYTLRAAGHQPDTPPLNSSDGSPNTANPDDLSASLGEIPTNEIPQVSFGNSAPASPLSNLSPSSPKDDDDMGSHDLNGLNITLDPDADGDKKPLSAAEIRAQKRKMKRFRLTHNQTRFLMSEFARQAHPDAAHRERLAREIPGLTPRQVQVWFQNRRAKLKRLTSDDRERMMRSRALPDDFDMTQALHSPFGAIQNVNSSLSSPGGYNSMSDGNMIRPLSLESLRRVPEGPHMSPIPGYGGFQFTPPQSVTDGLSPVSPAGPDSPFSAYSPSLDSQRRGNPFASGNLSSPSTFTSHPQIPRLQMHDRDHRSRSESMNSPLRPNLSYTGQGDMHSPTSPLTTDSNGPQGMMPYGLGYSYPQTVSGFAATANSRIRSFGNGAVPRRIEVGPTSAGSPNVSRPNQYSPTTHSDGSPQQQQGPQSATFQNYTSSPMSTPNTFSMMSAPHHISNFPNAGYLRQDGTSPTHESYGSELDDGMGDGEQNSEGISTF